MFDQPHVVVELCGNFCLKPIIFKRFISLFVPQNFMQKLHISLKLLNSIVH